MNPSIGFLVLFWPFTRISVDNHHSLLRFSFISCVIYSSKYLSFLPCTFSSHLFAFSIPFPLSSFSPLSLILSFVHFYSGKMHSISMHNHHQLPCLHCHPHSYIRTVSEISLCLSQSQTHTHTHGWSLVAESLVFFILEFMKTLYCLHGYTGSASDREVLAPSHEQRPMHKGTSWACQNMAPCHTYWSSLSSSPSLSLYVCVCSGTCLSVLSLNPLLKAAAGLHRFMCWFIGLNIMSNWHLAVWRELLKENREFFQAYFHAISPRPCMSKP